MGNCVSAPSSADSSSFRSKPSTTRNNELVEKCSRPLHGGHKGGSKIVPGCPSPNGCCSPGGNEILDAKTEAKDAGRLLSLPRTLCLAQSEGLSLDLSQTTSGSSSSPSCSFLSDASLLEEYSLGEELGRGRFGTVLACTRRADGCSFACKIIANGLGARDAAMEVEVLRRMHGHRGVVQLEGVYLLHALKCGQGGRHAHKLPLSSMGKRSGGTTPNNSCPDLVGLGTDVALAGKLGNSGEEGSVEQVQIVMERCYGGTIADRLREQGCIPEEQALRILHSILCTVDALHSHGFIYRDIKDTNFLFKTRESNSAVVAIDFGLAASFTPGELLREVAGSPLYIAPEVVRRAYGPQSDVWSAGVLLYQMISGRHLFERDLLTAVLKAVTGEGMVDLESAPWLAVSGSTKQLLRCMLNRDPASRPSPVELLRCLSADGAVIVPDVEAALASFKEERGVEKCAGE